MTVHGAPIHSTVEDHLYRRCGPVSLYLGDATQVLAAMPDDSVDCLVTSPPFWGPVDLTNFRISPGQNPRCPKCSVISRGGFACRDVTW